MSGSDHCERCGMSETYRHLLWECGESRRIWRSFNEYVMSIGSPHRVNVYDDILKRY